MKYAIIAAGKGSRLAQEGVELPKPLVQIAGECLIDRLIRIFTENSAESIDIIINEEMPQLQAHLSRYAGSVPLHVTVQSTPSSMHSLYALQSRLEGDKFCLTTVDTIFDPLPFARYIRTFQEAENVDALMAVTPFVEDEKPLYVATDDTQRITHFLDSNPEGVARYVSGGIYALTPATLPVLQRAIERGEMRMRNYQRALLEEGLTVQAYPFEKIVDVDHVEDIATAQAWLQTLAQQP